LLGPYTATGCDSYLALGDLSYIIIITQGNLSKRELGENLKFSSVTISDRMTNILMMIVTDI